MHFPRHRKPRLPRSSFLLKTIKDWYRQSEKTPLVQWIRDSHSQICGIWWPLTMNFICFIYQELEKKFFLPAMTVQYCAKWIISHFCVPLQFVIFATLSLPSSSHNNIKFYHLQWPFLQTQQLRTVCQHQYMVYWICGRLNLDPQVSVGIHSFCHECSSAYKGCRIRRLDNVWPYSFC